MNIVAQSKYCRTIGSYKKVYYEYCRTIEITTVSYNVDFTLNLKCLVTTILLMH